MSDQFILDFLSSLWTKLQIFLARTDVQVQIIAILAVIIGVGLLAYVINFLIEPKKAKGGEDQRLSLGRAMRTFISLLIFPMLGLVADSLLKPILTEQGVVVGLVDIFSEILWTLLGYRVLLGIFYLLFTEAFVKRFHYRLLTPIFGLYVAYTVLSLFIDVSTTATVTLARLSDNPLTLGALFLATIGLYFWVDGIWGLQEIIYRVVTRFTSINEGRLEATLTLGSYILVAVGILVALSLLGVDSTIFAAVTAGLSVGIGFGLQSVFNNFISGIIILFEGSMRPGDYIEVNGDWYWIEKFNIRSAHAKSWHGYDYIIPNQTFLNTPITNYSLEDHEYRLRISIKISMDSDHVKAMEILKGLVAGDERLVRDKVQVFISEIDQGYKELMLWFWIDCSLTWWDMVQDIHLGILEEFPKHGIEIPVPRRDIRVEGPWGEMSPDEEPRPLDDGQR